MYTNIDWAPGGISGNAESAGIFAISGETLRGFRHFPKADFTCFVIMFPLRGGGLLRESFPCVCGCKRYLFPATPRGGVSIYTNIDGAPGRISGKCGKRRKRREFRHFREILRGFGTFLWPILPVFIMFPLRGGLIRSAFPCVCGCERYLLSCDLVEAASIYTNIDGAPGGISGKCGKRRKYRKCRNFRHFKGNR